jgi:hypothetical protein
MAKNDIVWHNCSIKLGELKAWAANPRYSTKAQAARILKSIESFGQVQTVAISPDNDVYDGHQRLSALLTIHGGDYIIDARRSSRNLTDTERRRLVLTLHAGATGAFDWELLSGWDTGELKAAGMDAEYLKTLNNDANNLRELINSDSPEITELLNVENIQDDLFSNYKVLTIRFLTVEHFKEFIEENKGSIEIYNRSAWIPYMPAELKNQVISQPKNE